jgi:ELWxxDGT repeat protein
MVLDVNPAVGVNGFGGFRYGDNNVAFFIGNDGVTGNELWKSDGTAAGTVLVKDINSGLNSGSGAYESMVKLGSQYIFTANEPLTGDELYVTDGTAANTSILKNINPGSNSSYPNELLVFGNQVIFRASTDLTGRELWITDGTTVGTFELKDIYTGTSNGGPTYFTVLNGEVFFPSSNQCRRIRIMEDGWNISGYYTSEGY